MIDDVNRHLLPPAPWTAVGNTLKDGTGRTICVVFHPRYTAEIARFLAISIELDEECEDLTDDVRKLEAKVEELEDKLGRMTEEGFDNE
jgi:hypothetical protein